MALYCQELTLLAISLYVANSVGEKQAAGVAGALVLLVLLVRWCLCWCCWCAGVSAGALVSLLVRWCCCCCAGVTITGVLLKVFVIPVLVLRFVLSVTAP